MRGSHLCLWVFLIVTFLGEARAERHEFFSGVAKEVGGSDAVVYTENHDVTFDDKGRVVEATTVYVSPTGAKLATLKSDFRASLNLPEHIFIDEQSKNQYGIRRNKDNVVLFSQISGKAEEKLQLSTVDDKERVQIGCQGFNYFLKDQIESLKVSKTLPVLFMVPGDLSTYKFVLELLHENPDQTLDFKVKIENWFLRAFAPTLEFKYDRKINRIVWYKGISNIKNASGKNGVVEIVYSY